MQTQNQGLLTTPLDLDNEARRVLTHAGRILVKYKLSLVAASHGLVTQNLYTWLAGKPGGMGLERQRIAMALFGLTQTGRLTHEALHSWLLEAPEEMEFVDTLLTYESGLRDVRIVPAFTTVPGRLRDPSQTVRKFIGASMSWTNSESGKPLPRRVIVTLFTGIMEQEHFLQALTDMLAKRCAAGENIVHGPDLEVTQAAAESVWRWHLKSRLADGKRPRTTPNKGLLPFDQDIVGVTKLAGESAYSVLQEMTPRFKRLAHDHAKERALRVSTADLKLIRRAQDVIDASAQ